jgi:hypothetical protein
METANTTLSLSIQCSAMLPREHTCPIQPYDGLEQENRGSCTTKLAQHVTAHMRRH